MAFSSYQIERLIRRLRRWIAGPFPGRAHAPDPVRTTPGSAREAPTLPPPSGGGAGRGGGLKAIAESRQYGTVVEAERERRAGSFMDPPYPESLEQIGLTRIPKLKREVQPEGGSVSPGDAD